MSDQEAPILPSFDADGPCEIDIEFTHWSQIFIVIAFAYLWNAGLILWTLPWNVTLSFPYLGSMLSVMFESDNICGVTVRNWRQLGKKRIDEKAILEMADTGAFKFFVFIFTLNSWILFGAKLSMYLTFHSSFYTAWYGRGFTDFFNIEIALVTLLLISNIFFCFSILPSFLVAATRSMLIAICVFLIYMEMLTTFILLCIQWPLLISVGYIGACIILTGIVLGMAILCLLTLIMLSGSVIFFSFNLITCFQCTAKPYIDYIRSFSASITWLLITYLVWVSGVCLAFLFTTSEFQSKLCINLNRGHPHQLVAAILIAISITVSFVSLFILKLACSPSNQDTQHRYQQIEQDPSI